MTPGSETKTDTHPAEGERKEKGGEAGREEEEEILVGKSPGKKKTWTQGRDTERQAPAKI